MSSQSRPEVTKASSSRRRKLSLLNNDYFPIDAVVNKEQNVVRMKKALFKVDQRKGKIGELVQEVYYLLLALDWKPMVLLGKPVDTGHITLSPSAKEKVI